MNKINKHQDSFNKKSFTWNVIDFVDNNIKYLPENTKRHIASKITNGILNDEEKIIVGHHTVIIKWQAKL